MLLLQYILACITAGALRSVHTWRQVAATRRSDKSLRVCWRIFVKIFVSATSHKKSNQTEFVRLVAATKLCCRDKDFHQTSPAHTKRSLAATCRRNLLLQLVAGPVHMEWSFAATRCCNLSPSVYRPLWAERGERGILHEAQNECEARNEVRRSIKLLPSSRTSLKMPCSPRLLFCRLQWHVRYSLSQG